MSQSRGRDLPDMPCGMPAVATEISGHINKNRSSSLMWLKLNANSVPEDVKNGRKKRPGERIGPFKGFRIRERLLLEKLEWAEDHHRWNLHSSHRLTP